MNHPAVAKARDLPRVDLATLPTALEPGGQLQDGRGLYVKRDDLTGLGLGGNKARKLEFLVADAREGGADSLVTVGAGQSNHARMTAAAGARAGLETHLVIGGTRPPQLTGNQLLSALFGAEMHFIGTDDWNELEQEMATLTATWRREGRRPYEMPIGGSTAVGALGFLLAWDEFLIQCRQQDLDVGTVVHATSSGGTHAGLLAGQALLGGPQIVAVAVAKTADDLASHSRQLAEETLTRLGASADIEPDAVIVDGDHQGDGYAVPTAAADAAIHEGATRGAWVLDRVYTGKAFGGLLARAEAGRLPPGDVVFWHTGGHPAVFAHEGVPPRRSETPVNLERRQR